MADEQQVLQEAKKLPLGEQLAHSSWKVRAQALTTIQERVGRAFTSEDEIFAEAGARECSGSPRASVLHLPRQLLFRLLAPTHLPRAAAGPLLGKAVGDSNANVMDKAVETLVTYLEKANEAFAARCVLRAPIVGCQPTPACVTAPKGHLLATHSACTIDHILQN